MERVELDSPSGCWVWQGAKNRGGYGSITISPGSGRPQYKDQVHRVMYKLVVGPIPEGITIDHSCFSPACVNPAHMTLRTRAENTRRSRYVSAKMAQQDCVHGHPFTDDNTYKQARRGSETRKCVTCRLRRRAWNIIPIDAPVVPSQWAGARLDFERRAVQILHFLHEEPRRTIAVLREVGVPEDLAKDLLKWLTDCGLIERQNRGEFALARSGRQAVAGRRAPRKTQA